MSNGATIAVNTRPLTAHETLAFEKCCRVVDEHLQDFILVGEALATMKNGQLWRVAYPGRTWEAFVDERWGFTRQRAHQLMSASALAVNMSTTVNVPNERIARVLGKLEDAGAQRLALTTAIATAPEGKLTAEWVESTVDVVQDALNAEGLVDPGANTNWTAMNAAITAEAHKRMIEKRQQLQAGKQKPILNVKMSVRDLSAGIDLDGLDADATVRVVIYEDVSK